MRIELICTTETLLREIASGATQADVASTYGLALCSSAETDWARVNEAIIKRWSKSGLQRIKTMAWKRAAPV